MGVWGRDGGLGWGGVLGWGSEIGVWGGDKDLEWGTGMEVWDEDGELGWGSGAATNRGQRQKVKKQQRNSQL